MTDFSNRIGQKPTSDVYRFRCDSPNLIIDAQAIHHLIAVFKPGEAKLNARSVEISAPDPESIV
ncbi:hypothetical protein F6476_09570 [Pseudomonas umsongensis]|nr:hypothetical protein F6476_09570 [Pseudomonas umsongensis]